MSQESRKFDKELKLMILEPSMNQEKLNELTKEPGTRVVLIYR